MQDIDASTSRYIQAWRGIAVMLVVSYHFVSRLPHEALGSSSPPLLEQQIGKIGVLIFFVISGYLITKSLFATVDVGAFYAKRIARIWPLFAIASVVVYVSTKYIFSPVSLGGEYSFFEEERTFSDLIGSIFFLEDLGFDWMDGAYWSILVELKFYFLIGAFAFLFKGKFVRAFCLFSIIVSVVDIAILAFDRTPGAVIAFDGATSLRLVSIALHGLFISQYLPFFAIGVALAAGQKDAMLNALIAVAAACTIIALKDDNFEHTDNVIFLLIIAVIFAFDNAILSGRIFVWIGNYSYSIYLFHQVLGLSIIKALVPTVGLNAAILLGSLAITIIAWKASDWFEMRYRHRLANLLYKIFSVLQLNRARFSFAS